MIIIGCQSMWTRQLELNTAKGKIEMTDTAETLERQLGRVQLLEAKLSTTGALIPVYLDGIFGGDLRPILKIVDSTLRRIKEETDADALASDRDDQVTFFPFTGNPVSN